MKDVLRQCRSIVGWTWLVCLTLGSAAATTDPAAAATFATGQTEVVLGVKAATPAADLSFSAFGSRQIGPITPSVHRSSNTIRVKETNMVNDAILADNVVAPLTVGWELDLVAMAGVLPTFLTPGQTAAFMIEFYGELNVENTGALDAQVTFALEREYFLNAPVDDPATYFTRAGATFSMTAQSLDAFGVQADSSAYALDGETSQGARFITPNDRFDFTLMIPAGGTGRVQLFTTGYASIRQVPEPSALATCVCGLAVAASRIRQRCR